jgi:CheY-like chemotaxis protein
VATILIVEDEQPVREFLAELVEQAGHRALQAIHGGEALEVIGAERPDLVIADVMMPILGGVELCQRLKTDDRWKAIPVILTSSAGQDASNGAGCDAFLAKPFDLDPLEQLIRQWLAGR